MSAEIEYNLSLRFWGGGDFIVSVRSRFVEFEERKREYKNATKPIYKENYALTMSMITLHEEEVMAWCKLALQKIENSDIIVDTLKKSEAECVIWLAIFSDAEHNEPTFDELIISRCKQLNVDIFVENYTKFVSGNAQKKWITRHDRGG